MEKESSGGELESDPTIAPPCTTNLIVVTAPYSEFERKRMSEDSDLFSGAPGSALVIHGYSLFKVIISPPISVQQR